MQLNLPGNLLGLFSGQKWNCKGESKITVPSNFIDLLICEDKRG